ncbi:hypothetical protein AB0I99_24475 [Streptomyces spongiicola]|uniref:hypothetical protein n=1 Tax=Streptomyces spongiicola TaxID=1690221 RepID=UPI00157FA4EC|nr:hypothetical protein [Streptomyces spongiicola]
MIPRRGARYLPQFRARGQLSANPAPREGATRRQKGKGRGVHGRSWHVYRHAPEHSPGAVLALVIVPFLVPFPGNGNGSFQA